MEETSKVSREKAVWDSTKNLINDTPSVQLGPYFSFIVRNSPRRLLHLLSYYKFAAKMIGPDAKVMDVGCSEGVGTLLLAERANLCFGIDLDRPAIESARANFESEKLKFFCLNALEDPMPDGGPFDAITNFDVIEHIDPSNENQFVKGLSQHLREDGIFIIGTPSLQSDQYASPVTRAGHINLYTADRLDGLLKRHFVRTMIFSANDEVVHTGFHAMAHYLIGIGVVKK